jgi:hypothetical protein
MTIKLLAQCTEVTSDVNKGLTNRSMGAENQKVNVLNSNM